jgi:hypothetical protein
MVSFLTCNAKAVLRLILEVSYQKKDKIATQTFYVSSDKVYKITVADNMTGLRTYNCRITGYTMCTTEEVLSFVNQNTKPTVVDTLKIDYSEDNISKTTSINVCDIRYIEELSTSGFDEIVNREVPTFR